MSINSYKDLKVWQRSMELVEEIYKLTAKMPKSETYGLSIQMRRAAISIPSNIAEGYRRQSQGAYHQFLLIANGSAAELETQLELVKRLPHTFHLDTTKANELLLEVLKMLNVLIRKVQGRK
ncbi:hypothetical protein A3A66_04575 [Microgenomates group bacterium RIFCSPLOWO2_01_FULL_46_13]|nr:MAG: hypothetical protein A2783_05050 [Microgenomates group bacterium RIFCSPHIGHO2_01_FULL_45_11]OGV94243.1 MAG: hypothetical protein A3A66_04575 [Microgenomates group bacterium RIFCSPLOWO2_01_FULL_46_13]